VIRANRVVDGSRIGHACDKNPTFVTKKNSIAIRLSRASFWNSAPTLHARLATLRDTARRADDGLPRRAAPEHLFSETCGKQSRSHDAAHAGAALASAPRRSGGEVATGVDARFGACSPNAAKSGCACDNSIDTHDSRRRSPSLRLLCGDSQLISRTFFHRARNVAWAGIDQEGRNTMAKAARKPAKKTAAKKTARKATRKTAAKKGARKVVAKKATRKAAVKKGARKAAKKGARKATKKSAAKKARKAPAKRKKVTPPPAAPTETPVAP
jgi:hypothetical protein